MIVYTRASRTSQFRSGRQSPQRAEVIVREKKSHIIRYSKLACLVQILNFLVKSKDLRNGILPPIYLLEESALLQEHIPDNSTRVVSHHSLVIFASNTQREIGLEALGSSNTLTKELDNFFPALVPIPGPVCTRLLFKPFSCSPLHWLVMRSRHTDPVFVRNALILWVIHEEDSSGIWVSRPHSWPHEVGFQAKQ